MVNYYPKTIKQRYDNSDILLDCIVLWTNLHLGVITSTGIAYTSGQKQFFQMDITSTSAMTPLLIKINRGGRNVRLQK